MADAKFANYEAASRAYLQQFREVLDVPPAPVAAAARGAAGIPADFLIEHADGIADTSAQVTDLARAHLESADFDRREITGMQLVSQAAAELNLAVTLIETAGAQEEARPIASRAASAQLSSLRDAVTRLTQAMQAPTPARGRAAASVTLSPDPAANLTKTVTRTVGVIVDRVVEVGGDIVVDLIQNTEWNAVINGISLMNKNVGETIQKLKEGVSQLLRRAMAVVQKLILNVYDKILALFGKGADDQARQQVKQWIEKLKQEQASLAKQLVGGLYRVDRFEKALDEWLKQAPTVAADVDRTARDVDALAARFVTLAGYAADAESAVVLAKVAGKFFPQLLPILAGIQVTLLGAVVYTGFDYVGYKHPAIIDIVKGTAQVIHESIGFPI
jgi:hypothetical protein